MSVNDMFFPRKPTSYDQSDPVLEKCIWLGDAGKECPVLCALAASQPAQFAIVYLHGNYEDLGEINYYYQNDMKSLIRSLGAHFLAVEYPGYGLSPAVQTTPDLCVKAAWNCIDFVTSDLKVPHDRIIIYGRSIGSGVAMALSASMQERHCPPHAIILQSPFSATSELVKHHGKSMGFLGSLATFFVSERFHSVRNLGRIKDSALFLAHGMDDDVIPASHSDALAEEAARLGIRCHKHLCPGDHNRMGSKWKDEAVKYILSLKMPESALPPVIDPERLPYSACSADLVARCAGSIQRAQPGFFQRSLLWSINKLSS